MIRRWGIIARSRLAVVYVNSYLVSLGGVSSALYQGVLFLAVGSTGNKVLSVDDGDAYFLAKDAEQVFNGIDIVT